MKLFKKSTLGLALTAALTSGAMMGVTAPAQAVDIAHNGLGQALVFPYYTTRNNFATYFNITNTSDKTVAMKVRWREAVNSRDVLDFIVVLSPFDVWTAAIGDGAEGAQLITMDKSCTVPSFSGAVPFSKFAYTKSSQQDNRDKGSVSLDRTREGYFEVIETGVAVDENMLAAKYAKHNKIGQNTATPNNCAKLNKLFADDIDAVKAMFKAPEDNLKGRALIVNTGTGVAAGYDPLVLKEFSPVTLVAASQGTFPSLDDATSADGLTTGYKLVNKLINRNGVINDYNVKNGSKTDWVLTLPTKNFSVDIPLYAGNTFAGNLLSANDLEPFEETFSQNQDGKSCFEVDINLVDREEFEIVVENDSENKFSPAEPDDVTPGSKLCYEANILSFGGDKVTDLGTPVGMFESMVGKVIDDTQLPGVNGWAMVSFKNNKNLPIIGMRIEERKKDGQPNASFGFANDHAYTVEAPVAP